MKYELVCGIETHIELSTKSKIFCSCNTKFTNSANSNCCPVCIGLPGTLPTLNKKAVDYAIMAGLITNCKINAISKMDRKNYFYPDLAKGYQISQYDMPLCENGYIELSSGKKISIKRIHIEEDAGKLIYKNDLTLIDYNRAGIPLIEIVSGPDIQSSDEAREYLEKLKLLISYIGISDLKMQEGSMRCDVNISIRKIGENKLNTHTEIKNMNSITFIINAIKYEADRQIKIIENGGEVTKETRKYIENKNITESMRAKESINDYRYLREPDLVTISITQNHIDKLKKRLPQNPLDKLKYYVNELSIPEHDAKLLIKYKKISNFFDETINGLKKPKIVANLIIGEIFARLSTENLKEEFNISVSSKDLRDLALLVENKKITANYAKSVLLKMLDTKKPYTSFISVDDIKDIDDDTIIKYCKMAVDSNPKAVNDYLSSRKQAIKSLVGFVMKKTNGKANADFTKKTLISLIEAMKTS